MIGWQENSLWTGDQVHGVETADEDRPNFIVEVLPTDPRLNDNTVLPERAQRARWAVPEAQTLIADGG